MGPGSRRDVIDDHSGDNNWEKTTGMGEFFTPLITNFICQHLLLPCDLSGISLLRKVKIAAVQRADHENAHQLLTNTIPSKDIEDWTVVVESWEKDPVHATNPFEVQEKGIFARLSCVLGADRQL
jgi:hypothetical protein